ncbi:hypothetical protein EDB85DRAFT_2145037 [Lactarius pseudohatsudake]|nr:hypothetical protein EDB85DRAFT_2145037 [Lactarius pseudohatsudake]
MLTGVSVSRANDLLDTLYQLYRHAKTNEIVVRTVGYALPAVLRGHSADRGADNSHNFTANVATEPAKVAPGKPVTEPSSAVMTTPVGYQGDYPSQAKSTRPQRHQVWLGFGL